MKLQTLHFSLISAVFLLLDVHITTATFNVDYNESHNLEKRCIYRDYGLMDEETFNLWSGFGCYFYNADFRFFHDSTTGGSRKFESTLCLEGQNKFPCVKINNTFTLKFDYRNETMTRIIQNTFSKHAYYLKWRNCAEEALECCKNTMMVQNHFEDPNHCPAVWDGWSCFRKARVNSVVPVECPAIAFFNDGPTCKHYASKECLSDGQWQSKTDYTECSVWAGYEKRYHYYIIILTISIISSSIAIIIFSSYNKLQVTRVKLHKNLIIAIVLRNIAEIIQIKYVFLTNVKSLEHVNTIECRMISFFVELTTNWQFASMVLDGFYIYNLLVKTFECSPTIKYYFIILAGLCISLTTIWGLAKLEFEDHKCWLISDNYIHWINNGFRLMILFYNLTLFICIMNSFVEKIKRHSNFNHTRRISKVTFILTPLFGIQFLFIVYVHAFETCVYEDIYYYFAYTVIGLQGFIVSLIYCFLNHEVQKLLRGTFQSVIDHIRFHDTFSNKKPRRSTETNTLSVSKSSQNNRFSGTLITSMGSYNSFLNYFHSYPDLINGTNLTLNCCNEHDELPVCMKIDENINNRMEIDETEEHGFLKNKNCIKNERIV